MTDLQSVVSAEILYLSLYTGLRVTEAIEAIEQYEGLVRKPCYQLKKYFPDTYGNVKLKSPLEKALALAINDEAMIEANRANDSDQPAILDGAKAIARAGMRNWLRKQKSRSTEFQDILLFIRDFIECGQSLESAAQAILLMNPQMEKGKNVVKAIRRGEKFSSKDPLASEFFVASHILTKIGGNIAELAGFMAGD